MREEYEEYLATIYVNKRRWFRWLRRWCLKLLLTRCGVSMPAPVKCHECGSYTKVRTPYYLRVEKGYAGPQQDWPFTGPTKLCIIPASMARAVWPDV